MIIGTEIELDIENPSKPGSSMHASANVESADAFGSGEIEDSSDLFDFRAVRLEHLPSLIDRALTKLDDPDAVVEKVVIDRSAAGSNEVVIRIDCKLNRSVTFDLHGHILHVEA